MSAAPLLIGPLGPFEPDEDTTLHERSDGSWLVSNRVTAAPLRLSDANPSAKLALWAPPSSSFAFEISVEPGRAELFADGLLIAGLAPGEWLALAPGTGESLYATLDALRLRAAHDQAASDEEAAEDRVVLVDRSAGLAAFRLTGQVGGELLGALCDALRSSRSRRDDEVLDDGAVLTAPLAGTRCTIVRDDLLPEEFDPAAEPHEPLVRSYLLLCERSSARSLHRQLLEAGSRFGIEPEGYATYRRYHLDA